ncbi:MAG: cupin domain-containing protein [Bacteroidales bacterium]|nr:cupin domain-containing protein [Bacteroidales bacterium]
MARSNTIEKLTKKLNLIPHPEGGFYRETYRSSEKIHLNQSNNGIQGTRNQSTGIYFLLTSSSFSAFHRIKQDEMWHFYYGSPLCLHTIDTTGKHSKIIIGNNILQDQTPQFVVPAGTWFAAHVLEGDFSLVGCTVSPGFDFKDFELSKRETLISLFPEHRNIIAKLSRE